MSVLFELLSWFLREVLSEILGWVLLWLIFVPLACIVCLPFVLIGAAFKPGRYLANVGASYGRVLRAIADTMW